MAEYPEGFWSYSPSMAKIEIVAVLLLMPSQWPDLQTSDMQLTPNLRRCCTSQPRVSDSPATMTSLASATPRGNEPTQTTNFFSILCPDNDYNTALRLLHILLQCHVLTWVGEQEHDHNMSTDQPRTLSSKYLMLYIYTCTWYGVR